MARLSKKSKPEQSIDYVRGYNDAKREIALSGEYERAYQRGKDDALSERKTGKWIPISKATNPKKSGWYIVTISEEMTADDKRFSGTAEYNATTEEWYDMDDVAVIDSDYYNNPDNEGHFFLAVKNISNETKHINAGDRLAQAVFVKYGTTNKDKADGERKGGIGSTGV